jgi:2-dehydropantoate 2-reductase
MMKTLVVGAGATGGFYGGLLAKAGRDVTFLLRQARAQQVRTEGLQVVLHTGEELRLHPNVVTAADTAGLRGAFDLIILSTKAYQLPAAMEDIAPLVGPDTMVMPILNGLLQIEMLSKRFSPDNVIGGSVRIMSFVDESQRVVQMNALDQMNYGEISGERTERILVADETLRGCGFTANLQPDIVDTLWQKWMILASLGAACVVGGGNAGQINAVPHGKAFIHAIIRECTQLGAANGYPVDEGPMQEHLERMLTPGTTISSSMYRDMTKGAPVEADHILGDLLARAKDVSVPLLTAAYVRLKVYEESRQS